MKTTGLSNDEMFPVRRIGLCTKLAKEQSHYCFLVWHSHQNTCKDATVSMPHLLTGEGWSDCDKLTYWICSSFGLDPYDTDRAFFLSHAAPAMICLVGLVWGHANLCDWTPLQMVSDLQKDTNLSALLCPAQQ